MMTRLLRPVLFVLISAFALAAETLNFSQLTVIPYGVQEFDISTGITTLPDGGDVVDTDTNLSLSGSFVRFADGAFIEATGVTIDGEFGTLSTATIFLDLVQSLLQADEELTFTRAEIELHAGSMVYHHETGIAAFYGGVTGTLPPFTASTLLLDSRQAIMLLVGAYEFTDGMFALRSPSGGGMLQVHIVVDEETGETDYIATSNPDEAVLAAFQPYLE